MGFDKVDKEQLRQWALLNQPKGAEGKRQAGLKRNQRILDLLNSGADAREISIDLDLTMSATYTAIHRAKKSLQ